MSCFWYNWQFILARLFLLGKERGERYSNESDLVCCSACVCFISLCVELSVLDIKKICICLCILQGQVHWGFACCRLVQKCSWLIVCSLGCVFMRLRKCVRHQQGKAGNSGPSNWIYTCWRRPGFVWNKRLYSTHPTQSVLLFNIFHFPDVHAGAETQPRIWLAHYDKQVRKSVVLTDSAAWREKWTRIQYVVLYSPVLQKRALTFVRVQASMCSPPSISLNVHTGWEALLCYRTCQSIRRQSNVWWYWRSERLRIHFRLFTFMSNEQCGSCLVARF